MKLNYQSTQVILDALSDLLLPECIRICAGDSDYVTLDQMNGIGFEVFDEETRVDFFDDHQHFGRNYADTDDFAQDTALFLRRLLSSTLVKTETFKGLVRVRYEWFFLDANGRREPVVGPWLKPLFTFVNPFARKETSLTYWRFQREAGTFVQITADTVALHSYDWDILIHIRKSGSAYTFQIERCFFDEEGTMDYCWTPLPTAGVSFYDTQENALRAAKEAAGQYCLEYKDYL